MVAQSSGPTKSSVCVCSCSYTTSLISCSTDLNKPVDIARIIDVESRKHVLILAVNFHFCFHADQLMDLILETVSDATIYS